VWKISGSPLGTGLPEGAHLATDYRHRPAALRPDRHDHGDGASGSRFRLAAPVAGGVMGDPGFAGQAEQILSYWRETAERPPAGGNPAALGSLLPGIADRAASPASVSKGTRITLARRGSWDRCLYWAGRLSVTVMIPLLGVMAGASRCGTSAPPGRRTWATACRGLHHDYRESRPGLHADLPHERHLIPHFTPAPIVRSSPASGAPRAGASPVGQHEAGSTRAAARSTLPGASRTGYP
jgi:hypothetical protein